MDIMENQGRSLADRPRMDAARMLSGGLSIVILPAGDRFRRMRRQVVRDTSPNLFFNVCRALHTHLQPKAAEAYEPLQMSNAKNTVLNILDDPYNFQNHVIT